MNISCIVACHSGCGPTFFRCTVTCTEEQYSDGHHYDRAKEIAADLGYDAPMVVFDENDGPTWLFESRSEFKAFNDMSSELSTGNQQVVESVDDHPFDLTGEE